jgi:diaminopimelate epimerase
MREYKIVVADPAKNITVFVLDRVDGGEERAALAKAIMADSSLKAEQVGFVIPPPAYDPASPPLDGERGAADTQKLWRLEMMGGEFCGNASRSFGLLVAQKTGLSGRASVTVKVSGAGQPLEVHVDTMMGNAEIEMPLPLATGALELNGRIFPVYEFEGISHVIIEDCQVDADMARDLLQRIEQVSGAPPACGFLFFDADKQFLQPVVWVRSTGIFVRESSCGSGCAALGLWVTRNTPDVDTEIDIAQPGGMIRVHVAKQAGRIQRLSIGGKVTLGGSFLYSCPSGTTL